MIPRHFFRMARWARKPPSPGRVKLIFAVIAICLVVAGIEWLFGWPDALRPQSLTF